MLTRVPAGFPSPAEEHLDHVLDLNELIVRRPTSTFFVRVEGESMRDAGIRPGDILVIDRAEDPRSGSVVLAALDGDFTVKRFLKQDDQVMLQPEHPDFPPIVLDEHRDFIIWGVVTFVIRALRPCSA